MRGRLRSWSVPLIGLGSGAALGAYAGPAVSWWAAGAVLAGLVLYLAVPGVQPAGAKPAGAKPSGAEDEQPTLAGLGTRVEQILQLAEDQADETVRVAHEQARAIVEGARAEAAGRTSDPD